MRYTEAPARRMQLLRRLEREGYVSSARLAAELDVSEMTIRRDLRQLHGEGLAHRVPGGASRAMPFEQRSGYGTADKNAIARACADLLTDAQTVALDAGTTIAPLGRLVGGGTMVVSHSVPVIVSCTERTDIELIGIGGNYQPDTRSFAGPVARATIRDLSVDVAVLSATALGPSGVLSASALDAELKRELAGIADRIILLVDHTKLGARAPIRIGPLTFVDTVVTDAHASPEQLAVLHDAGLDVVISAATDESVS